MSDIELNLQHRLRIRRGFRLQWEPVQNCHVLLYPEGMIQLNDSAAHILKLVDGQRSIEHIINELQTQFPDVPGLDEDILTFMGVAHAQFWLECC
ncbi:MAG: pyrroloquinoline quinone biosynthesis peptide chaperone PqqD [Desulfuromonas sp.]|nr:pyrroloquinoline quinone biosynthesis peptide chaperone PqqD [Desulfuromonas sp.]